MIQLKRLNESISSDADFITKTINKFVQDGESKLVIRLFKDFLKVSNEKDLLINRMMNDESFCSEYFSYYFFKKNYEKCEEIINSKHLHRTSYSDILDIIMSNSINKQNENILNLFDLSLSKIKKINEKFHNGSTIIFWCYRPIFAERLINKGLDINLTDDDGNTCLMNTQEYSMMIFLLKKGLDPEIKNKKGINFITKHVNIDGTTRLPKKVIETLIETNEHLYPLLKINLPKNSPLHKKYKWVEENNDIGLM